MIQSLCPLLSRRSSNANRVRRDVAIQSEIDAITIIHPPILIFGFIESDARSPNLDLLLFDVV